MHKYLLIIAAATLTACSEKANDAAAGESETAEPARGATQYTAAVKSDVESIVREFSGDANARVSIAKVDGGDVCGAATIHGRNVKFYVDLVDGEAMFSDGMMKAVVAASC